MSKLYRKNEKEFLLADNLDDIVSYTTGIRRPDILKEVVANYGYTIPSIGIGIFISNSYKFSKFKIVDTEASIKYYTNLCENKITNNDVYDDIYSTNYDYDTIDDIYIQFN